MDTIFAVRLLSVAGKSLNKEEIMGLYKALDTTCIEAEVSKVIDSIGDRNIDDLIQAGKAKMCSAVVASAPVQTQAATKEEKKEEKKVEEEEDEDFDMFGGL